MKNFRGIVLFSIFIIGSLFITGNVYAQTIDLGNPNMQCYCTCQSLETIENEGTDGGSLAVVPSESEESDEVEGEEEEPLAPVQIQSEILPGEILISEFVSDPIPGEKEWVEIYNSTDELVDLTGWMLIEGSGQVTFLNSFIGSSDYLKVEKNSLNNSGDIIILQNSDGDIIDQVSYGDWDDGNVFDNAPSSSDPYSIIRKNIGLDYNIDFQDFDLTLVPTPGLENIYETAQITEAEEDAEEISLIEENEEESTVNIDEEEAIDYSDMLKITEIYPNPEGSDTDMEWIEIKNISSKEINLKNWKVDDVEGGSSIYEFVDDLYLGVGEYYVLSNTESKLILNNTSDQVRLFAPDQSLVDMIEYDVVKEDYSYAFFESNWEWTIETTPGKDNILYVVDGDVGGLIKIASAAQSQQSESSEYLPVGIEDVYTLLANEKVEVNGVVTVEPGVFSSKSLYLQNEKGIEVYDSKENFPNVKEGQLLSVEGKVSSAQGDKRILATTGKVSIVNDEINPVVAQRITSEEIDGKYSLTLVELEGVLVEKSSSKLILADEFGEFEVYVKKNTNISSKTFNVGEKLKVSGILSLSDGQYRILPRRSDDIENLTLQQLPVVGQLAQDDVLPLDSAGASKGWYVVIVVFVSLLSYFGYKYKDVLKNFFQKKLNKKEEPHVLDFSVLQKQK